MTILNHPASSSDSILVNSYFRTSELVTISLPLPHCQQKKDTHGWDPVMKSLYHLYSFTLVHGYFRIVT